MTDARPLERKNQRFRTRKDLIAAAARLMKEGRTPTLDEIAEAALVSRATAYRYFPNVEALLVEASFDITVPDAQTVFADVTSTDAEERTDMAEAAIHRSVYENEHAIRLMLASTIARAADQAADETVPIRQNRRSPLIDAALAPMRTQFDDEVYAKLRAALALIFGSESMIVFRDVLGVNETTARAVKSWAVRTLVGAAIRQSRSRLTTGKPTQSAPGKPVNKASAGRTMSRRQRHHSGV
jgi:AcrR family transcriptional regulator